MDSRVVYGLLIVLWSMTFRGSGRIWMNLTWLKVGDLMKFTIRLRGCGHQFGTPGGGIEGELPQISKK
jgi:hypothetical protein